MVLVLNLILVLLASYISAYLLYNISLLTYNFFSTKVEAREISAFLRFYIVIPAHNEELLIENLLASLNQQVYPPELFEIYVVADNCNDNTAEIARSNGVNVVERKDDVAKGKGYAIKYAIDNAINDRYDALLIIDADSILDENGLVNLNKHILDGKKIIQCNNAVGNPNDSWFSQLLDISRSISNEALEPAKEKMGLSSHLMGNGMCFHREIIKKYGWNAFSVGEDWEYYSQVITQGERVAFAQNVRVSHQESVSFKQATSQRMRWSSGRFAILWRYGLDLFIRGLFSGNLLKFDASLPLVLPNASLAMNLTILGFLGACVSTAVNPNNKILFIWYCSMLVLHFIIFIIGVFYTKNKLRAFLSIFIAPLFLAWKMGIDILSVFGIGRKKWVRTKRHPGKQ